MSKIARILIIFSVISVFAYMIYANSGSKSDSFRQESNMIGQKAPDFSLKSIENKTIKLSSFKGKVVILDFWATWCPPCRAEIPDFIELQKQYEKKGLIIIGVALDKIDAVKKFVKSNKINYKIVMGDQMISGAYGGIEAIPTTFIIAKDMVIKKQYVGQRSKEVFEKDIKELF